MRALARRIGRMTPLPPAFKHRVKRALMTMLAPRPADALGGTAIGQASASTAAEPALVAAADTVEAVPSATAPPTSDHVLAELLAYADRPERDPSAAGDRHYEVSFLRSSPAEIEANFAGFSHRDGRVGFLEGWCADSLPTAPIERLAVLRLDSDTYSSAEQALTALYGRVSPGGFVIVDNYGAVPACRTAVDDFRAAHGIATPLEYIDGTGRYWRVPRRFEASERARLLGQSAMAAPAASLDTAAHYPTPEQQARLAAGREALWHGDTEAAARAALDVLGAEPNCAWAHGLLAEVRLPGDDYLAVLRDLHLRLAPRTYVEIGVFRGASITLAQPATRALGVDPRPILDEAPAPNMWLFECTSGTFFAEGAAERWLDGGVDLAFVDGSHQMATALLDFMALERLARPGSTIVLHDTLPIDEAVATPVRATTFYCGDVWKVVAVLREYRPDLVYETVACQPSGLTIVGNLDPDSRVLWRAYDEIVAHFGALPFSWFAAQRDTLLNVRPAGSPGVQEPGESTGAGTATASG